ncbi:MAG: hypothetical protein O3C43_14315 [Verrucomicrobia bacterium]|nr:hypothetical protein [Verrucomicrobiota bacterium]MDA1067665.1 hypothetical protein [Verrucomicrobiota bacterium]
MSFESKDRELLAALADVLIPAGDGFPSASQAGVAHKLLDTVIESRPDLVKGLQAILKAAVGRNPVEFMNELRANDEAAYGILTELVPGAYFLNEQVRARLKYDGQSPRPIDPRADCLDDNLLQSVIDRGPVFRPTPTGQE